MSFNRFFVMYNEPFMYVEPVAALTERSNHTANVVKRGDIFAVNMNSGALTVITKKKLDAAGYSIHPEYGFNIPLDQKGLSYEKSFEEFSKATVRIYRKNLHIGGLELSSYSSGALSSLRTIFVSNTLQDIFDKKMLYVYSNRNVIPVNFTNNDSWGSYSEKIRSFYRKHGLE